MYIGAGNAVANNQFAIARINNNTNTLQGLTPSTIKLNNTDNQTNPLCGAQISFLKLNNDKPVALAVGDNNIYRYSSIIDNLSLSSAGPINDASGAIAGAFLALETANGALSQSFVACTPNGDSNFGGTGSGVALFEVAGDNYVFQNDSKAVALDNASSAIGINNAVTLANTVELHWSGELNCLFVGLQAQAGSTAGNGARSIVVGKVTPVAGQNYDTITFEEFVPSSAISGNNQIIGTGTAGTTVSALKIKTLRTSTCLNYLIVNGGNSSASSVGNLIYALPIVSGNNANKGHLATYNQTPTDIYTNNFFVNRTLDTAATNPGDLLTNTATAAIVGGGQLPLNANETISDLFVSGDSVYASIGTTAISGATGIFQSQAILDQNGLISGWTQWQHVSGYQAAVFGAAINAVNGSYWYLTGSDASNVNAIQKTVWSNGSKDGLLGGTASDASLGLVANLSTLFPKSAGGVFNLVDISKFNLALNGFSMLIATGANQVALINTDAAINGDFSSGIANSNDDAYPVTSASTTIARITGNNLSTASAITTAHIATNASGMSWIILGGSNGVVILRQASGDGWSTPLTSLGDLDPSYSFELFSSYQFVQKITSDANYLYILTQNKLDKIALNSANLASSAPTITTVVQVGELLDTTSSNVLNDVIITGDLAILATSAGLFRTSNGTSIHDATPSWTSVDVPEQLVVPSTKLIEVGLSFSDRSNFGLGGNLYLVSSYRGLQQTIINRFYVNLTGAIDDNTILPLPDLYIKNSLSYFINFESFRDNFFTDGTLLINSLSRDVNQLSYAQVMLPGISSGTNAVQINKPYNLPLLEIAIANLVSNIVRSTNSGALLISGEFGIVVNE